MSFSFTNFWAALQQASSHVITLAAGASQSVHDFEAGHPIVMTAIHLVEQQIPGFAAIDNIAHAVISAAQTTQTALQTAASTVAAAQAAGLPVGAISSVLDAASSVTSAVSEVATQVAQPPAQPAPAFPANPGPVRNQ